MRKNLFILVHFICLSSSSQTVEKNVDQSEFLFNGTIKINTNRSSGTGFFFIFFVGKDTIPVIVTNKHVIDKSENGYLTFNSRKTKGSFNYGDLIHLSLSNFNQLWITHPTEDIAILPLMPIVNRILEKTGKHASFVPFDETLIPSPKVFNDFIAVENIFMIGYPKGLSDSVNNLPILRKGVTATPLFNNYNGKQHFLLDIPIYGGSSGSPIVIYNDMSMPFIEKQTGSAITGSRIFLVGIAVESKEYSAIGETIPTRNQPKLTTKTWLPFEVASAIKSNVLLEMKTYLIQKRQDSKYGKLLNSSIN